MSSQEDPVHCFRRHLRPTPRIYSVQPGKRTEPGGGLDPSPPDLAIPIFQDPPLLNRFLYSTVSDLSSIKISAISLSSTIGFEPEDHLVVQVSLSLPDGRVIPTHAMIDTGAAATFIDEIFASSNKIPLTKKKIPRRLEVVDGRPISSGDITHDTIPLLFTISDIHSEDFSFTVTRLGHFPIILGLDWCSKHDPVLSFSTRSVLFTSDVCNSVCLDTPSRAPGVSIQQILPNTTVTAKSNSVVTHSSKTPCPCSICLRSSLEHSSSPSSKEVPVLSSSSPVIDNSTKEVDSPVLSSTSCPVPSSSILKAPKVSMVNAAAFNLSLKKKEPVYLLSVSLKTVDETEAATVPMPDESPTIDNVENLVPSEYHDFLPLFSKSAADKLPDHRPNFDHAIEVEPGSQPPFGPIYSLSEVELKVLHEYIQENLQKGFIRHSKSPAGAPILFVKKADGSLRLCVDYRGLNKITIKNRQPLPLIGEALDRLKSAKIYSKLDLRNAYHQIRLVEGQEWMTAFRTRYGLFEYQVMPFGLTNAPATFQHFITDILRDFLDQFVLVYLDDILIYSDSVAEHKRHVRMVLERLQQHGLHLKPEKCQFHVTETEYLGYIISPGGIRMDPEKVSAIAEWEPPKSIHDLQVFLGFANYYRRFIKNYSKLAQPLTSLLRKETKNPFPLSPEALEAFEFLKTSFTTAPILAMFDPTRQCIMECDASDFAIAGVLSQKDENDVLHPIAFYSRKLNPAELNYEIHDKELLAIVQSIQHWRHYLEGAQEFLVFTDHKNLEYFMSTKVLNRRQSRWKLFLSPYHYQLAYRSGTSMGKPDALSRRQQLKGGSKASEQAPQQIFFPEQLVEAPVLFVNVISEVQNPFMAKILRAQSKDPSIADLIHSLSFPEEPRDDNLQERLKGYSLSDGLLFFNDLLYVPDSPNLRLSILAQVHDSPSAGHFGQAKTFELLTRDYWWPSCRAFVNDYVKSCDICARGKASRHKPYGPLQPLPVPDQPWLDISWDFITGLPTSPNGNDAILVIVDRFSKMAHFIPCSSTIDAQGLAQVYIDFVYRPHGLSRSIVSDRGTLFTSQFWRAVSAILKIENKFSTAFHPQTDGQTERINGVLEQYLRMYCNHQQDNWESLLSLAEFAYNNSTSTTTGKTPFFVNHGYHPVASFSLPKSSSSVPYASDFTKLIHDTHDQVREMIAKAQENQKRYFDKGVSQAPSFSVGQKVWLSSLHLHSSRPSKKLEYKKFGPFPIESLIGRNAVRLTLPTSMKCHPVFHVSLLEPEFQSSIPGRVKPPQPPVEVDGEEEWEVEEVLDSQVKNRKLEYFVKWKGWPISEQSWQPVENLENAPEEVARFHAKYPDKPSPSNLKSSPKKKRRRTKKS